MVFRSWHQPIVKRRFLWLAIAVLVMAGIACSQRSPVLPGVNDDVLRLGVIATQSGETVTSGESTVSGAQLAAQAINQSGGIKVAGKSRQLELLIEDDRDEVDAAVNAARKLIYQDEVVAIVGPQFSRNAIPVSKVAETAKVLMLSPRSTNPETTAGKQYVFRTSFIDPFQGEVMANFALTDLKAKTAGVLYDVASAYNKGIAEFFQTAFTAGGGQVVAFEAYTTGEKTFTPYLERIKAANPDVLLLPNYENEVPLQVLQAQALGITAKLLGVDSWGSLDQASLQRLDGSFYSDFYAPDANNPKVQQFIQAYQQAYGREPDAGAAATYDAVMFLAEVIQHQGKTDSDSIRQGFFAVGRYEGVTGTIEYQDSGDPVRSVVILQVKEGLPVKHRQVDP